MKLQKKVTLKCVLLLFFICCELLSQSYGLKNKEIGQPLIKYYSPGEYKAGFENWCVTQDNRGIMYFGNDKGILEYNGAFWRLIKIPNNSIIRSLSIDENGKIYIAASSDFGYLAPDSAGQLQFYSLLNYLPDNSRTFGDIWDVVVASHGIYFKTQNKIFRWNGSKIKIFESVNAYRLYKIGDDVFVRDGGVGLLKISGDILTLVPDGEKFASLGIYDMLPFGNKILVTTNKAGLFLYDGKIFSRFKTEVDAFLYKNGIYNACGLQNGYFAFATQRGGVVVIDKEGHLQRIINSSNGLQSDIIYDIYQDHQAGLWAAMGKGISRIEIFAPFTIMPNNITAGNYVSSIYRFHNTLYASNSFGLLYLDESSSKFNNIAGVNSTGGNFVSIENSLFAASNNEICKIENGNTSKKLFDYSASTLYQSVIDSNIIYVVYRIGIAVLKYNNGTLQLLNNLSLVNDEMSYVVEDSDGSLWINTPYEGIVHLINYTENVFSTTDKNKIKVVRYNKRNGLPGRQCTILSVNGKTLFATDVGLFRFDSISKNFIPDYTLGKPFTNSSSSILLYDKNSDGDLWILAKTKNGTELGKAVKQNNGRYSWQPDPVFQRLDLNNVFTIYSDYDQTSGNEILWISSDEGLIRFNPQIKNDYKREFHTCIRNVIIGKDSLIFGGIVSNSSKKYFLSFDNNNILFQFSVVSYDKSEANRFQYFLEGEEDEWLPWTYEKAKKYSNLSAGDYKFHVRSKNVYGVIGREDVFAFTILSPWYFSWWTYALYSLMFAGLLYQIRRFEIKRLNKKHTFELELVEYKKLKELDQLKSQFFANISHEFRTPLTLILGQVDSVLLSNIGLKEKSKLHIANRNARRLLTLINQLLDLSKLEAGSMKLKAEQHNIVSFLKSLFYSFESLAESHKIALKFESEFENIPVVYDPDKMEKVFSNLISNAFKFTSANGQIQFTLNIQDNSVVEIRIKDTGKGISKDQLPHIFNRFYQADSSDTREFVEHPSFSGEGTGIGLALVKELIELHKGSISVDSEEGKWTEFIIHLLLGDLNLEKEKMVNVPLAAPSNSEMLNAIETEMDKYPLPDQNQVFGKHNIEVFNIKQKISRTSISEIILVVEDNSDVRNYIREQTEIDYKIIEADNGEEGILMARDNVPDLIITDVMMPKMDGYKFSREIRMDERTSHIPIIMLTAKAGLDDKIEGLETGIDAYLTKPFSAKELKVQIKNLIIQRKELCKRFSKLTIIKPSEVTTTSVDQIFLEKTIKIIEAHFVDEQFGVDKLAETVGMSASQINRKLNALIDQPAGHLIRSLRLQRAADLLKQNAGSVAEICYNVGFNDQAYFSRTFKKQFGCSPSDFKKSKF